MEKQRKRPVSKPASSKPASITNTIIAGTLGAPAMFSLLLILNAVLVGVLIERVGGLKDVEKEKMQEYNTRMMLLGNDVRDMESVLISHGYAKPADFTKPSDVGQHP